MDADQPQHGDYLAAALPEWPWRHSHGGLFHEHVGGDAPHGHPAPPIEVHGRTDVTVGEAGAERVTLARARA